MEAMDVRSDLLQAHPPQIFDLPVLPLQSVSYKEYIKSNFFFLTFKEIHAWYFIRLKAKQADASRKKKKVAASDPS